MREKIDFVFVGKCFEREYFVESEYRSDIQYAQYTTIFVDKERNCRFQRVQPNSWLAKVVLGHNRGPSDKVKNSLPLESNFDTDPLNFISSPFASGLRTSARKAPFHTLIRRSPLSEGIRAGACFDGTW